MPDTPIDQSEHIPSIRLKVPTGTVPIPPVGYAQLHSPSPGELALRLPDGSVVEIGAAAGAPRSIAGTGGGVNADSSPGIVNGLTIAVPPGKHLWLNVPDVLFGPDQVPFGVQVYGPFVVDMDAILALSSAPVGLLPTPGATRFWWLSRVVASYHYGGGVEMAFTGGSTPSVGYPDKDLLSLPGLLLGQVEDALSLVLAADTDVFNPALALGQPVLLKDAVPYAGGDPDSTLTLWLQAAVVDVAGV